MITEAKGSAAPHSPKRAGHASRGKVTEFKIHGRVTEEESGMGVANLRVRAYDKDLFFDDLLGCTDTEEAGDFSIHYTRNEFRELFRSAEFRRLRESGSRRMLVPLEVTHLDSEENRHAPDSCPHSRGTRLGRRGLRTGAVRPDF